MSAYLPISLQEANPSGDIRIGPEDIADYVYVPGDRLRYTAPGWEKACALGLNVSAATQIDNPIDIPEFLRRTKPVSVLDEAKETVYGDRTKQYGSPTAGFGRTAALWSAYLGVDISAKDCAALFALNKFAREKHRHKRDNLVDLAGYAEVMNMIEHGE